MVTHFNVCLLSLMIFMMMFMTECKRKLKHIFLFCMPNDAYEHMKMLLNVNKNAAKIVIESELGANVCFLAPMNASSLYWSSIHANECVFYRNEQQKVYMTRYLYTYMIRYLPPLIIYTSIIPNRATNSNLSVDPVSDYEITFLHICGN